MCRVYGPCGGGKVEDFREELWMFARLAGPFKMFRGACFFNSWCQESWFCVHRECLGQEREVQARVEDDAAEVMAQWGRRGPQTPEECAKDAMERETRTGAYRPLMPIADSLAALYAGKPHEHPRWEVLLQHFRGGAQPWTEPEKPVVPGPATQFMGPPEGAGPARRF